MVDHDRMLRRAERLGHDWYAAPYLPETRCRLLPGGKIEGQSYVTGWRPVTPGMMGLFDLKIPEGASFRYFVDRGMPREEVR